MGLLDRVKSWTGIGPWTSSPGPNTGGPVAFTDAGMIPFNWPLNFGQLGYDPLPSGWNSIVYSCIMLYARTIAQLPGTHRRKRDDNGTDLVVNSAASRVLRQPNDYQTRSDFIYNLVVSLLYQGNAYGLVLRNDRFEPDQIHLLRPKNVQPYITEDGEVFYSVGGNPILDQRQDFAAMVANKMIVPARDLLHVRVFCPRNPLIGEPPLEAAQLAIMTQGTAQIGLASYYQNMSRPSGVLMTDLILKTDQVNELRARWEEQSRGINIGGVPILTAGLKWVPSMGSLKADDAQVVESMKFATADIARVYGVPLALINDMTGATWANTEQLMNAWLAMGLGFYLEHIELCFDKLFGFELKPDFIEFDIQSLARSDFAARVEGLVKGVQGGLYSPNEARALEGLPKVPDGDSPRVQQQMVPLSYGAGMQPPPAGGAPPPAATSGGASGTPPAPAKEVSKESAFHESRSRVSHAIYREPVATLTEKLTEKVTHETTLEVTHEHRT